MKITVTRTDYTTTSTISDLAVNGIKVGYTLEDVVRPKEGKKVYGADVTEYKRHCEAGTLYAYLMSQMNLTHLSKKEFKKRVFKFFYAKNEHVADSADFICFSALFPTVAAYIVARKREDYKALACAMQKLESSIIIDTVVTTLATDYPNTWALTIHDSVSCTEDMVDVVYNLLNEAFLKHGVTPTINIEAIN